MASITKKANGRKVIQLVCPDGKRRSIRLGKIDMAGAKDYKHMIEAIASRRWGGLPPTLPQVEWLNELTDDVHERLASCGVVSSRIRIKLDENRVPPLGEFIDGYLAKRTDLKRSTLEQYSYTRRLLVEHFKADTDIGDITPADAEDWQRWMKAYVWKPASDTTEAVTLAPATISKHTKRAKTIFGYAVKARLIAENPMDGIKCSGEVNRDRDHFIDRDEAEKILDSCPDHIYRLAFALGRYGGLRMCEILTLEWSDCNWADNELIVRSPKTGTRYVPMFAELRPYLDQSHELADDGAKRCLGRLAVTTNLGVQMMRYVRQAGVKEWKKPFQNLRATRRTELEEEFPSHVCDAWLGHSTKVAKGHYLQVTKAHLERAIAAPEKAVQKAVQ
ncbi:tyrosine-type recombinase/integrase [Rhodopirellula sp. MGV]|uniref:tyrosine-type recombinase/integrase n=1 Tax=Rhodopirellula sp. MGV TaxID=2023130 RepID=UPI000B96C970|nr:tyrosine-type recombinase/integrase [Rhodopirellula sp. MGV]OYP34144.1 hypothetical protein CGZ80_15905 [Rhodopirellula sp. MGV]PNY33580.1 hypothetical protein C2E31_27630 [Rhodopirellula baltica]